ncbi:hypothetical protein PATSB16_12290 [Pandoraea thiooxydans]|nr:hypothetical protein PATSB16_12290 [Pandoraea thiooxydans]
MIRTSGTNDLRKLVRMRPLGFETGTDMVESVVVGFIVVDGSGLFGKG